MPYLIDGNNLFHAARACGPRSAVGRVELCRLLANWKHTRSDELTVVFDGPPPAGEVAKQMARSGICVRFSGSRSADEVIEDELASASAPGRITVVTTDRAIQHAARYRRARCIDSEVFVLELYHRPKVSKDEKPPIPEKPVELSEAETQQWLEEFGPGLDEPRNDTELME